MRSILLLLCLIFALVKVHHTDAARAPYISFGGSTLANHSYVNLTAVWSVRCHTDMNKCCSSSEGPYRGDWYFPNGSRLLFSTSRHPIYEGRRAKIVVLHYTGSDGESGIYRCTIETNAVKSDDIDTLVGENVYVGLYEAFEGNSSMVLVLRVKL